MQKAAAEIASATGRRRCRSAATLGSGTDCDRLADTVYKEFGRCDVLVNNAGMSPLYDDLPSVTEALYDKVHAVNARGPFRLGRALSAHAWPTARAEKLSMSPRPDRCARTRVDLPYAMAKAGAECVDARARPAGHRRSGPTSSPGPSTPT